VRELTRSCDLTKMGACQSGRLRRATPTILAKLTLFGPAFASECHPTPKLAQGKD